MQQRYMVFCMAALLCVIALAAPVAAEVTAGDPICDLTIASGPLPSPGTAVFALEPNLVRLVVRNDGPDTVTDIMVTIYANDVSDTVPVNTSTIASLAGGKQATIYILDPTIREHDGGTVAYTAALDPMNIISETDETNNVAVGQARDLLYNGYKGKRYWKGGNDVTTVRTYDIHGDIIHSFGDSRYMPGSFGEAGWTDYTVTWTAGDLPLPAGATIRDAWLYVPYCWDNTHVAPDGISIDFNDIPVSYANWYRDVANFGVYSDYVYGLMTYNVTDLYKASSNNTVLFTRADARARISPAGFTLVVIYEDASATRKQIFVNEEFDLLGADRLNYGTDMGEATAYVPFSGMTIVPEDAVRASLTTFVPWGNGPEGNLYFNGREIGAGVWDFDATQVAVDEREVTEHLSATGNEAAIQGDEEWASPTMVAAQTFLVVEYADESGDVPVAEFTATPLNGLEPLSVQFADTSAGSPTAWVWELRSSGTGEDWTDFSTDRNSTHDFAAGAYDIRLTVTNARGSDTVAKTQYISSSAGARRLATIRSGTVSGDLYVEAYGGWGSGIIGATNTLNRTFTLPVYTDIQWARLYAVVYAAGTDNRAGTVTVGFDGDGDGTYDLFDTENLATAGDNTASVYPINDHANRQYSDYMFWYDVTDLIGSQSPKAEVVVTPEATNFDGRIKELALVVAYDDGDDDVVHYWVNDGHDWQAKDATGVTSTFATDGLAAGWTDATLKNIMLSTKDALYTFNGAGCTGADAPGYLGVNIWDVRDNLTAGSDSSLTYVPNGGSYKTTLATLSVRYPGAFPDLVVTGIAPNAGEIFAHEPNNITATVANVGDAAAGAFDLKFAINNDTTVVSITGLTPNATTTVEITDPVIRPFGDAVTITVTADAADAVLEADETNNAATITKTAVYNGYKGKRYTDGGDLTTQASFSGRYNITYSTGNTAYCGAPWAEQTKTWTAADLPIPADAIVVSARLYQGYSYNKMEDDPAFTLSFNDNVVTPAATYSDIKNFGSYSFPYGMYVYNVTEEFDPAGNSMKLTPEAGNNYAIYGAYLVVVYEDASATRKTILINDEFDMLYAYPTYAVTSDEATAYAPFTSVDTDDLLSARAVAILYSAGDTDKSKFFFNDQEYAGFWTDYQAGPQLGFSTYDVTTAVRDGTNEARLQSYNSGTSGDNMYATTVILVAEYTDLTFPDLVVSTLTPNKGEVFSTAENTYTATITNIGTGDAGAFDVEFNVSGETGTVAVAALAAGNTTTVTWTDETVRAAGDIVTITATVDPDGLIDEANEENNQLSIEKTVVHNGYRGMRWTDGDDIATAVTYDVYGDLLWSTGNSSYLSAGTNWADCTVAWTESDIEVPENAEIVGARLYVPYTWDKGPVFPDDVTLTFNGETVEREAFYEDEKGWGSSTYPYGMTVYDVTDAFSAEGNTALLTNTFPGGGNVSIRGMLLAVVYDDGVTAPHTIIMNEGFDLLFGGDAQGTTPEQATAYAPFHDVDTADAVSANLVTVAPGAGSTKGDLLFNDQTWTRVWNYAGTTQIGVDERDVTSFLAGENLVGIRSDADYIEAAAAFLIIEYPAEAGEIFVTSTPAGAAIWLDGEDTGEVTDTMLTNVPAGAHTVQVSLDGYLDAKKTVTVTAGATTSAHFNLDASAIILQPGWNFISTPKQLADGANTIAIFDGVDTANHSVLYYNGSNRWETMNREEVFRPLDGVWIYANGTYEIPLAFAAASTSPPPTKYLDEGWNAIGFSDIVPEPAVTTLRSVEPAWTLLFGWRAGEQAYDVSIIRGASDRHGETRELFPTQGYWLYMNEADTLAAIGA